MSTGFTDEQELSKLANKTIFAFFLFVFLALKLIFSSCAECQTQVSWPQMRAEAK